MGPDGAVALASSESLGQDRRPLPVALTADSASPLVLPLRYLEIDGKPVPTRDGIATLPERHLWRPDPFSAEQAPRTPGEFVDS